MHDFSNQARLGGLETILADPRGRAFLMKHMINEYAVENLRFYEEVQDFKHAYVTLAPAQQVLWAQRIFIAFIPHTAFLQVNLPHQIRFALDSAFANPALSTVRLDVFDQAAEEVVSIMRGSFSRFLRSKQYAEYMAVR